MASARGPAPDLRLQVTTWLRLTRVQSKIERRAVEQIRRHGLSYGQFDVLAHVGAAPGISQQQLADALLVTKGNASQLLDKMEASGLLERRQEGRANHISLTARGRALYAEVVPEHEGVIADAMSGLSSEEQRELHELLRRLERAQD